MHAKTFAAMLAAAALLSPAAMAQSSGTGAGAAMESGMSGSMSPSSLNAGQIRQVQEALNAKGGQLQVDGVWGPNTKSALQKFQQEQGMQSAGGELNADTLAALDIQQDSFMASSGSAGDAEVGMGSSSQGTSGSSSTGSSGMGGASTTPSPTADGGKQSQDTREGATGTSGDR